jgi:hypothetical protein
MQTLRWSDADGRHVYLTPDQVAAYVLSFDDGQEIEPFAFSLVESRRVPVRAIKDTPAKRARGNARRKVERAEAAVARIEADPDATPAAVKTARVRVTAAREEADTVVRVTAGQPGRELAPVQPGERARPPLGGQSKRRVYGGRLLRVNQQGKPWQDVMWPAPPATDATS